LHSGTTRRHEGSIARMRPAQHRAATQQLLVNHVLHARGWQLHTDVARLQAWCARSSEVGAEQRQRRVPLRLLGSSEGFSRCSSPDALHASKGASAPGCGSRLGWYRAC
jgi:hypothetical protein